MKITVDSLLMNIGTGEYPLTLLQVRQSLPDVSFAYEPEEDALFEYDIVLVQPVPQPAGDVVFEGVPQIVNGRHCQNWQTRAFTPDELVIELVHQKEKKLSELNLLQTRTLHKGTPYTFPDGEVGHIQLRDGDRANVGGLNQRAEKAIATNLDVTFAFRDYEDELHSLTPVQATELAVNALDKFYLILQQCWELKDQVKRATTVAELPVIPEELTNV